MASKLDSLVSVQICCEMNIFKEISYDGTLYSYKNSHILLLMFDHSVCAWSKE